MKSRWATDWDRSILIKNFGSDFVAVALNRGWRGYGRAAREGEDGRRPPEFFVIPTAVVQAAVRAKGWGKVPIPSIPNHEQYRDAWQQVREHLG